MSCYLTYYNCMSKKLALLMDASAKKKQVFYLKIKKIVIMWTRILPTTIAVSAADCRFRRSVKLWTKGTEPICQS